MLPNTSVTTFAATENTTWRSFAARFNTKSDSMTYSSSLHWLWFSTLSLFMLGRQKPGQSKPDVISLVPNKREWPLLSTCRLYNCKQSPVCTWPFLPQKLMASFLKVLSSKAISYPVVPSLSCGTGLFQPSCGTISFSLQTWGGSYWLPKGHH